MRKNLTLKTIVMVILTILSLSFIVCSPDEDDNNNNNDNAGDKKYTLTLTYDKTMGSLTKNPDKTEYDKDETVTLTATANDGFEFVNWNDDTSLSDPTLSVTMDENKTVTAIFQAKAPETHTLTVTVNDETMGSVTKDPDKAEYDKDESVTLTATANDGFEFVNWNDDESLSDPTLSVTMDEDKTVTATFQAKAEEKPKSMRLYGNKDSQARCIKPTSDDGFVVVGTNIYR